MGFPIFDKQGNKKTVLLNPSEKGQRYSRELKKGTNHKGQTLNEKQRAYRGGYLDARRDNADAYRYNKAKRDGTLDSWRAEKKARRARRKKNAN